MSAVTDVETLRAAAGRLRGRAAAAALPGAGPSVPWHVEECADGCACIVAEGLTSHHNEPSTADRYIADAETPGLGAWIALMHLGVAEPLAAWLVAVAEEAEKHAAEGWGNCETEVTRPHPLAVARAVLDGGKEQQ